MRLFWGRRRAASTHGSALTLRGERREHELRPSGRHPLGSRQRRFQRPTGPGPLGRPTGRPTLMAHVKLWLRSEAPAGPYQKMVALIVGCPGIGELGPQILALEVAVPNPTRRRSASATATPDRSCLAKRMRSKSAARTAAAGSQTRWVIANFNSESAHIPPRRAGWQAVSRASRSPAPPPEAAIVGLSRSGGDRHQAPASCTPRSMASTSGVPFLTSERAMLRKMPLTTR